MEALSVAGIPVYAERGMRGGWALLEEYRTNLTGLNRSEIQALFLSKPSRLLADLGLEKASDAAFLKLLASLPSMHRADAEYMRQRIYVDPTGWRHVDGAIPFLSAIQEAVWQGRKLYLEYERSGCEPVERIVDPLGLVAKGSVWYLVAAVGDDIRSYRVSRVSKAGIRDEPSARPEGFDLESYWEQSTDRFKQSLPRYAVKVRVTPRALHRMPYAGRFAKIENVGSSDEEGWVEVLLRFDAEEVACEYVLGFGSQMEILEPRELRDKVVEMAKRVIEFYEQRGVTQSHP
jgi:predicted DNA-binding transcriptional regulator YafY